MIKLLGEVWRHLLVVPALAVCLVVLVVPALVFVWWQLVGRAANHTMGEVQALWVGRYLGCYPFAYAILAWCYVVATFLWAGDHKAGYRTKLTKVIDSVLDGIHKFPQLKDIGGIW